MQGPSLPYTTLSFSHPPDDDVPPFLSLEFLGWRAAASGQLACATREDLGGAPASPAADRDDDEPLARPAAPRPPSDDPLHLTYQVIDLAAP